MVVSICHTSALTEPIARDSRVALDSRGEESEMTPTELQERENRGWERKITVFRNPTALSSNPSTARERAEARPLRSCSWTNFVEGGKGLRQALKKFLQFFDKALHLNPSPRPVVCHDDEVGRALRRAEHHMSLLL